MRSSVPTTAPHFCARKPPSSTAQKSRCSRHSLRLRQASCHPGLIDPTLASEPSAKLDMLLPQLAEVVEEGHKVLVFSQFTSFLAIVRERLDTAGLTYEYLDGRTRNRAERVERFQTDKDCGIFLISLKAGGLGLNLTAARIRLPPRPLVEPRRRGPGDRPLAPHRPNPARFRLPTDLPRHRRGKDPRTPATQTRPRRRHPKRRQPGDLQPQPGRPRVPCFRKTGAGPPAASRKIGTDTGFSRRGKDPRTPATQTRPRRRHPKRRQPGDLQPQPGRPRVPAFVDRSRATGPQAGKSELTPDFLKPENRNGHRIFPEFSIREVI